MKTPKNFNSSTPLRLMLEAFAIAMNADNLEGWLRVLFDLSIRFGQTPACLVNPWHLMGFACDPNRQPLERRLRLDVAESFWRWATKEKLELTLGTITSPEGASGSVLSVEDLKSFLSQTGRPWTIPYLASRFFLGMDHSAALGFMIGGDPSSPKYPVIVEQLGERQEERHDLGSAVTRWLEPYRCLRTDEPFIQDPRISEYIAQQASSVGILWDDWLPTRTYCAYRLALTGDSIKVAEQTEIPLWFVMTSYDGRVTHHDAVKYFDLTPRTCRRHNWNQEVKQCLEWYASGCQFGASLRA